MRRTQPTTRMKPFSIWLGLLMIFAVAEEARSGEIHFGDFTVNSADFQTNNSSNYFIQNDIIEANTYTNSQEYGTFLVNYQGGNFTLSFDIKILDRTTGDTNFGLFSDSRKSVQNQAPRDPTIYVVYGGFEQGLGLRGHDANGDGFSLDTGVLFPFNADTVYHNVVTYDATTQIASLSVSSPTDPNFFSGNVHISGGLPELPHLGVSATGSWISSGRYQRALIGEDLSGSSSTVVPEPLSITLLGIGAISLLGYGWRRKRLEATDGTRAGGAVR